MSEATQKAFKKIHDDINKVEALNEDLFPVAVIFYTEKGIAIVWTMHQGAEIEEQTKYIIDTLLDSDTKIRKIYQQ